MVGSEAAPPDAREAGIRGGGLPCLFSHNCDNNRVNVGGRAKKLGHATRLNIEKFVALVGLERSALFTVTFDPRDLEAEAKKRGTTAHKEASRRLQNFARRVLLKVFGRRLRIREFHESGKPHFHILVECHGDVREGFDWLHYDAVKAWRKAGKKGPKPQGNLNRSALLVKLHEVLNAKGPDYGIGRMELIPVRHVERIGFYLGGYLAKDLTHKPADAKGTRSVSYTRNLERAIYGAFSWATHPRSWLWRMKLRTWAARHGCETLDEVKGLFGSRWAHHHWDAITAQEVCLDYFPTVEHARAAGEFALARDLPAHAIGIQRTPGMEPLVLGESIEPALDSECIERTKRAFVLRSYPELRTLGLLPSHHHQTALFTRSTQTAHHARRTPISIFQGPLPLPGALVNAAETGGKSGAVPGA
jgi:hypothetical protein